MSLANSVWRQIECRLIAKLSCPVNFQNSVLLLQEFSVQFSNAFLDQLFYMVIIFHISSVIRESFFHNNNNNFPTGQKRFKYFKNKMQYSICKISKLNKYFVVF